jgi:hypothetical protein
MTLHTTEDEKAWHRARYIEETVGTDDSIRSAFIAGRASLRRDIQSLPVVIRHIRLADNNRAKWLGCRIMGPSGCKLLGVPGYTEEQLIGS